MQLHCLDPVCRFMQAFFSYVRLMWWCDVLGDWCDAVLFLETDVMLYFSWRLMWCCTFLGDWCDTVLFLETDVMYYVGDWCDAVLFLETDVILYFAWRLMWYCTSLGDCCDYVLCWRLMWCCTVLETEVMYCVGDWYDVLCLETVMYCAWGSLFELGQE